MNPIAQAAKNLPGHWIKEEFDDDYGNHCGLGHLTAVLPNDSWYSTDYYAMQKILDTVALEQFPERIPEHAIKTGKSTFVWLNDHDDTVESEIVAVMEKAAVKWDEQV